MSSEGYNPGHEDMPEHIQVAREVYEGLNGEAPPVNVGEASNGFVRIQNKHDRSWRDYNGVKGVDVENLSYNDLVAEDDHTFDSDDGWHRHNPQDNSYSNSKIGTAAQIFQRMTGDVDNLLEPDNQDRDDADTGPARYRTGENLGQNYIDGQ